MKVDKLRNLRREHKVSQKELAEILGISQQTVASWETGRTEPSNEFLRDIADVFNVSVDSLLGRENLTLSSIPQEETSLLEGFRSLTKEGKNTLMTILDALKSKQSATA